MRGGRGAVETSPWRETHATGGQDQSGRTWNFDETRPGAVPRF